MIPKIVNLRLFHGGVSLKAIRTALNAITLNAVSDLTVDLALSRSDTKP